MSAAVATTICPGCGLAAPAGGGVYERKFHASAECWALFERVLAAEFESAVLFGRAHQLSVDAYAVQHAGGGHPDKSVAVHLAGLCLVLERGVAPVEVPKVLQRIAAGADPYPHFEPPPREHYAGRTVRDVAAAAAAGDADRHIAAARAWATRVWEAWRPHHPAARALVDRAA